MEAYAVADTGETAQILKSQELQVFPQRWTVERVLGMSLSVCVRA